MQSNKMDSRAQSSGPSLTPGFTRRQQRQQANKRRQRPRPGRQRLICLSVAQSSRPPEAADMPGPRQQKQSSGSPLVRLGTVALLLLQANLASGWQLTGSLFELQPALAAGAAGERLVAAPVDTKYWRGTTELGRQANWRSDRKPCTLLERVAIEQRDLVVSLSDALDALGGALESGNIRQFGLAHDGVLLLDEGATGSSSLEPLHLMELEVGPSDCYDSSDDPSSADGPAPVFVFEPHPDDMSWFNAANWLSMQTLGTGGLVPDSHQVPCSEDVVVFGDRRAAHWPVLLNGDGSEQTNGATSFKVNFRPPAPGGPALELDGPITLRVSKLKIGNQSYTQSQFDQLMALYGTRLFDFLDEQSVFNRSNGDQLTDEDKQHMLAIDESSVQPVEGHEPELVCQDEAGCPCGNERADVMKIICAFHRPFKPAELACHDPIQTTGYCDKICATNVIIVMEPNKFSEPFLANQLNKLADQDQFRHLYFGARRVDYNKYEVVIRSWTADNRVYEQTIGRELQLAQLLGRSLGEAAIKSFYGIKSVSIRSSTRWRRDNRFGIFLLAFALLGPALVITFVHTDLPHTNTSSFRQMARRINATLTTGNNRAQNASYMRDEPILLDQDGSVNELSLIEPNTMSHPEANYSDLAIVDTRSITDSTHNLVEPEGGSNES